MRKSLLVATVNAVNYENGHQNVTVEYQNSEMVSGHMEPVEGGVVECKTLEEAFNQIRKLASQSTILSNQEIGALVYDYELSFVYHDNADTGVPQNQIRIVAVTVTSNLGKYGKGQPAEGYGPNMHAALRDFLRANPNLKKDAESRLIGRTL